MGKDDQYRLERLDRGIKVRTEGIYAISSWREMGYLLVPRLVLIVGLLTLPLLMPSAYWQRVISNACIYALLAIGFDLLAHFVGLVSLGGAFFIGVGGYLAGILSAYKGMSMLLTIPIAVKAIRGSRNYQDRAGFLPAMSGNVQVVLLTQLLLGIGYILAKVFQG